MNPSDMPQAAHGAHKITYTSYLKVPELLALQQRVSDPPHHDELLFIIAHQVYELWFKQILHELHAACDAMDSVAPHHASHNLRRCHTIQHLLIEQVATLETMFAVQFNEFRDNLRPASGFQSVQFRMLEFLCGVKNPRMMALVGDDAGAREILQAALERPTILDHFLRLLAARGLPVPEAALRRNTSETWPGSDAVVDALLPIYRDRAAHHDLFMLAENLLEFDERFSLWRYRHVLMVERMIGARTGTGGSTGAKYLQGTLTLRLFPDLWNVRNRLGGAYG